MKTAGTKSLKVLMNEMKEESAEGAFFCDFNVFCKMYQLDARRILRLGIEEYVLLFTVKDKTQPQGDTLLNPQLMKKTERLGEALQKYLRVGDVVTRYSATQFLVMLPVCRYESAKDVVQRILNMFEKNMETKEMSVHFELAELTSVRMERT